MSVWLAWCVTLRSESAPPTKPRICVVTAYQMLHGTTPPRSWVATLCRDQPETTGPIYFGPKPPSDLPPICETCARELRAQMPHLTLGERR
jgi:hypothetical protein